MIALGWLLIIAGVLFFVFGSLALLRFPDLFTRLHALTKADNLGLGMICAGVALHAGSLLLALKLLFIWLLVMYASASVSQLISRVAVAAKRDAEQEKSP
jgi:multicomponent Na+:H+ antiporter subunit G